MTPTGKPRTNVVLLVDDQAIVAEAIRRMLAEERDLLFHHCADVTLVLPTARKVAPTVILQDLVMPGSDGFSVVTRLRSEAETANVPIIVLSARDDPRDKSRALELGANDYLVKIPDRVELIARIRAHSRAFITRLERDEAYRELERVKTQLEAANAELENLSVRDPLTGLANRRCLDRALETEWRRCQREGTPLAIALFDIDEFKKFNDTQGHQAGDACLQRVADILRNGVRRPADLAARYGGEEFAVVLPNTHGAGALEVANTLRHKVADMGLAHAASSVAPHVTTSAGVACCMPSSQLTVMQLLGRADAGLYQAKSNGKNRCVLLEM